MMKHTILYLALCLLAACEMSNEQNEDMTRKDGELMSANDQVVVFYNVENLFDLENDHATNDDAFTPFGYQAWTRERYIHKLDQISKVLYDIGNKPPMIIGLVEVENYKVVEDLSNSGGLSRTDYKIAQFDSEDRRGIDCAMLFDAERVTILEKEKMRVRLPGNSEYLTRDILYVEAQVKGGEKLHVFANHWSSRREGQFETEHKRLRAATVLKERVDQILEKDAEAKILILGDFNDTPADKSITQVLDAKGKNASFFNLMADAAREGEGTIVYKRDWYMFDQIIVSQNLLGDKGVRIKDKEGHVYKTDDIIYTYKDGGQKPNSTYGGNEYFGGFSDHLPVYITLEQ